LSVPDWRGTIALQATAAAWPLTTRARRRARCDASPDPLSQTSRDLTRSHRSAQTFADLSTGTSQAPRRDCPTRHPPAAGSSPNSARMRAPGIAPRPAWLREISASGCSQNPAPPGWPAPHLYAHRRQHRDYRRRASRVRRHSPAAPAKDVNCNFAQGSRDPTCLRSNAR
jgi:hypothetical protein